MQRILVVTLVLAGVGGCSAEVGNPPTLGGDGPGGATSSSSGAATAGSVNPSSNAPAGSSSGTSSGAGSSGGVSSGTGSSGGIPSGGASSGAGSSGGLSSGAGSSGATSTGGLPCDVQQMLANRCQSCHSSPPVAPAPMPLMTYANLMAPSLIDMTKNYAQVSVSRMQNTALPMPPAPASPATAAEIATLQNWISGGYPMGSCGAPSGGGSVDGGSASGGGGDAGAPVATDYNTPVVCTSKVNWTGGNGTTMRPGEACIACHSRGEGPGYGIAGTLYPTAHEPNDCNGVNASTSGATVVIIGKNGTTTTLTPNNVGNFTYSGAVSMPYQAKVVKGGKERVMATPQMTGDCNSCHTETGANGAPGRIMLP